jgi:hypothetical protein
VKLVHGLLFRHVKLFGEKINPVSVEMRKRLKLHHVDQWVEYLRLGSRLSRFTRPLMYGICSSCLSMRALRYHSGLYSTGLPVPSVWRLVQRVGWIGVKSRFSNKSLGEPTSFINLQLM